MVGLAFASVPLYQVFCQVTGYAGTPKIDKDKKAATTGSNQLITVRFNADTARGIGWKFKPVEQSITLPLGEERLAFYQAKNSSGKFSRGTATFNVTPMKAAQYFVKVDCFCFTDQRLAEGESADLPVSFYVDPEIYNDPLTSEVKTITLSYTFFPVEDTAENKSKRKRTAGLSTETLTR